MLSNSKRNIKIEKYWNRVCDMKLLDQVRDVMHKKHYSIRTEQVYVNRNNQLILLHFLEKSRGILVGME